MADFSGYPQWADSISTAEVLTGCADTVRTKRKAEKTIIAGALPGLKLPVGG